MSKLRPADAAPSSDAFDVDVEVHAARYRLGDLLSEAMGAEDDEILTLGLAATLGVSPTEFAAVVSGDAPASLRFYVTALHELGYRLDINIVRLADDKAKPVADKACAACGAVVEADPKCPLHGRASGGSGPAPA